MKWKTKMKNRKIAGYTSGFFEIWRKNFKWVAFRFHPYERVGVYDTPEEAKKALEKL
jgi:hypothetical protein